MNFYVKHIVIIILMFFIGISPAFSQKKVHVLTKTIKKELKAIDKTLMVKGEKATINVSSWDKNYFYVELKLISKSLDKKDAEKDLNIIKYQVTEANNYYLLKNYFSSKNYSNVKSNLSAIYNIKVPKKAKLDLTNIYGKIILNELNSTAKLKNSFGEIHITKAFGSFLMDAYYSDVWMKDINLQLKCEANKSDIEMENVAGVISINANYGAINITTKAGLKKVVIDSKRTTVNFGAGSLANYNYALSTKYSKINLPAVWQKDLIKKDGYLNFNLKNKANNPLIQIKTTYCEISIKNQ